MNAALVDQRLTDDLEYFLDKAGIVIKDDQGNVIPFRLNIAQRWTHYCLEQQRKTKGWVRALVLKGRQQGLSTYINGRYFHHVMRIPGRSVFILSHEGSTTNKLFAMVRRFYDNMEPALKPVRDKDNPHSMTFPGLEADYAAGTAGNEQSGRGGTAQRFHWSEAAYTDNAYEIQDGALESIRLADGNEVIIESTANGPGGFFHEKCMGALHNIGDYILIFCCWFWEEDYERDDDGSPLTEEEIKFCEAYFTKPFPFQRYPISRAKARRKLMWRRKKVEDYSPSNSEAGKAKFRSVYPSNPIEAFLATGIGEIRPDAIMAARASDGKIGIDSLAARVGGCDPAGESKKADRTILAIRQGRVLDKVLRFARLSPTELLDRVAKVIEDEHLDMLFVDNAYGRDLVDHLKSLRFRNHVLGVWFQEQASEAKYLNKRSEILTLAANWVNEGGVSLPDGPTRQIDENQFLCSGDEIHADLAMLPTHRENANSVISFVAKDELIKKFKRSPDILDAVALTFSFPVKTRNLDKGWRAASPSDTIRSQNGNTQGGGLRSLARKRGFG